MNIRIEKRNIFADQIASQEGGSPKPKPWDKDGYREEGRRDSQLGHDRGQKVVIQKFFNLMELDIRCHQNFFEWFKIWDAGQLFVN